jgi:LAS superfamily LD-carboxypeptidase LdcB
MIRLKNILFEQDDSTKVPKVLFIGDRQTLASNSYASQLLKSKIIDGKLIGRINVTPRIIYDYVRNNVSDLYTIVTIMFNLDQVNNMRDVRYINDAFSLANRKGATVIAIITSSKKQKDKEQIDLDSLLKNITADIKIPINIQTGKITKLFSNDIQNLISKRWVDGVNSFLKTTLVAPEPEDVNKKIDKADSEKTTNIDTDDTVTDKTKLKAVAPAISFTPKVSKTNTNNGKLTPSQLKSVGKGHELDPAAADAFLAMKQASYADGLTDTDWKLTDSYRTYDQQNAGFDWELYKTTGKKKKKGTGGRIAMAFPGTSNHGLGKAIDLQGKAQDWVRKNGEQYGWSWDEGQSVGEPWHFRYKL